MNVISAELSYACKTFIKVYKKKSFFNFLLFFFNFIVYEGAFELGSRKRLSDVEEHFPL